MQRRLTSLRLQLVGLAGFLAAAVALLTVLAAYQAPVGLLAASGAAVLAAVVAGSIYLARRVENASAVLSDTLIRLARGEQVSLSPTFREGQDISNALSVLGSELRQRVLEAREGEERYRAIAESLPAMVWIVRFDGSTIYQNRRVSDYTGLPFLADQDARAAFIHPDDQAALAASRIQAREAPREYQLEVRLRRHDGTYRWHAVTTAPLGDLTPDAERPFWVATAVDIEDLKQAEELQTRMTSLLERRVAEATQQLRDETAVRQKTERQLRQSQKMEAITRLTGGIAHDLNNKLMVISANIDAVTKHIKDQPQLRRKLLAALVGADQAAALISKLLAFARQRDLQVQYIDIAEHLESIVSLLDRSFVSDSVEVHISIPEDLWPVEVDPHELETAIVNLGVNARDAMRSGGTITIEARNIHMPKGSLSDPELAGDFVQIVMADTGEGIAPQNLEHVFEPFFTTKDASHSSGLGLSQVHGFVRQLGGTVEISSTIGQGTSVALYLPRAELPARVGSKPELEDLVDDEEETSSTAEILVVDDEVEVALALQSMLEESGYVVRTAIGADEAVDALRTRRASLVLTDVTMPGTMDGVALARQVRQMYPDLPVVLITGNPMVVAESSEFPLLQKPINSRHLSGIIQRHLTPQEENKVVSLFSRAGRDSS
jgi:PAS domain S-box-containing protein